MRGRRLSTLWVSVSPSVQREGGLGGADRYCEILMTRLFFGFITLGFGEAQTGNRVLGIAMPGSGGLGSFGRCL